MSVIVEFAIDWTDFELGRVLGGTDATPIELERIVPVGETVMPFFWVTHGDAADLGDRVADSDYITNLVRIDRVGDRSLYRVEWTGEYDDLVQGIAATEGTILEAQGDGEWFFRLRFVDHEYVADFYDFCTEYDLAIDVRRVYSPSEEAGERPVLDLTDEQREALELALRRGYFETPRETTMAELATDLDISQQAFSDRMRRGEAAVLRSVLLDADDG